MIRETVLCRARSMPRHIPVELCVPNPAHPACKQCDSPNIELLKPEDHSRLRSQDALDDIEDDDLFDDPCDLEPDEEDFEELDED